MANSLGTGATRVSNKPGAGGGSGLIGIAAMARVSTQLGASVASARVKVSGAPADRPARLAPRLRAER